MWLNKYADRVWEELKLNKTSVTGKKRVDVYVYDLLEESGLDKTSFYQMIFATNRLLDDNIVLYLKGRCEHEE